MIVSGVPESSVWNTASSPSPATPTIERIHSLLTVQPLLRRSIEFVLEDRTEVLSVLLVVISDCIRLTYFYVGMEILV